MDKKKNIKLGDVTIIDLSDELDLDDSFSEDSSNSEELQAFSVPYGATTGCSSSCGSSTFCC